jgi:hypothetical protein
MGKQMRVLIADEWWNANDKHHNWPIKLPDSPSLLIDNVQRCDKSHGMK